MMRAESFAARALLGVIVVTSACVAGGCVNLSQSRLPKAHFAIEAPAHAARAPSAERSGSVRVMRVRVAPPSDGRMFVYRVGEHEYTPDYFNVFIADPDQMLTAAVVDAMSSSGPFVTVVGPGGGADASMRLETNVLAMYADLRDASRPSAFIRARFVLLVDAAGATRVLGQWTHEHAQPVGSAAPADLAAGWGVAWGEVLSKVSADASKALGLR